MIVKVEETGIKVADMEGETVDNKLRLEALKQLETLIEEEKIEQEQLEKEKLEKKEQVIFLFQVQSTI